MTQHRKCALVVLTAVMGLAADVATAHHSAAMFEDYERASRAKVVDLTWRNPHVLLHWDETDANGKTVRWVGEMASVTSLMADGLKRDAIKPGDELIVAYRPAKDGKAESVIGALLRPDGTIVLPWSRQAGGTEALEAARKDLAAKRLKMLEKFGITVKP
jgi:hypothetical protein